MKNKWLFSCFLLLTFSLSVFGKVLVVVDSIYYNETDTTVKAKEKVDRYINELITIDSRNVELILSGEGTGNTRDECKPLWDILTASYAASVQTQDTVEGAVLIGDIPAPIMLYNGDTKVPGDYYYMDIWDTRGDSAYGIDTICWSFINTDPFFSCTYKSGTNGGDGNADIWVSRICARYIWHLRDSSITYDSPNDPNAFIYNYLIISQYLDRVHDHMTGRSEVPPHASLIGPAFLSSTPVQDLKQVFYPDTLKNLHSTNYLIEDENRKTPFDWQAQLQAGPYGNINSGAYKGVSFGTQNDTDRTRPEYEGDTRGFEWACLYEHSGPTGTGFGTYWSGTHIPKFGNFDSFNNVPLWTRMTDGGYNGSYYNAWYQDLVIRDGQHAGNVLIWYYVWGFNSTDPCNVYIHYTPSDSLGKKGWVNFCVDGVTKDIDNSKPDIQYGISLNQSITTYPHPPNGDPSWHLLTRYNPITVTTGDTLNVEFAAFAGAEIGDVAAIADAIMIYNTTTGSSVIIDNDDNTADKWVIRGRPFTRSFLSIRDNGGESKSKFYLTDACSICRYTWEDNLGNLYALGHNGLICIGGASSVYTERYLEFMRSLNKGNDFGKAFLENVNKQFHITDDEKWTLLGAGTLYPKSFKPYIDLPYWNISNIDFYSDYGQRYIGGDVDIEQNVNVESTGSLKIAAGGEIHITPEFHAYYGSAVHFKIDHNLQ